MLPFVHADSLATGAHEGAAHVDGVLVALMVVALSVQGPTLFVLGGMDFTCGHALVGIVGALSVARCLLARARPVLPSAPINVLLALFAVITVADAPAHGFGSMIFKYVFQYLVLVVTLNLMVLVGPERSERMVLAGAWVVLGIVLLNAAVNFEEFLHYYESPWNGHPNYPTVFSGGPNLEATWPAMLGVFCHNDRRGRTYLALAFALAALLQSRAGLMLSAGAIVYVVLLRDGTRPNVREVAASVLVVILALLLAVAGPRALSARASVTQSMAGGDGGSERVAAENETDSGASRKQSPAKPQGVPGRQGIWPGALEAFGDAPILGYGAGNAMDAVRSVTGYPYREDNVHNYPLQVLLDFGLVGFAAFVAVVVGFLVQGARARLRSPFAAFLLLYLIGGLVQFRGGELLVGFALAGLVAFGHTMRGGRAVGGDGGRRGDARGGGEVAPTTLPKGYER